jgi:hypothetical protein
VNVTDRWVALLRRRADAQVDRANLAAMRRGLFPAGWVYGLNDQRQAAFGEQRRILLESSKYLFRQPVTGPDGGAVAIFTRAPAGTGHPGLFSTRDGLARHRTGSPPLSVFASA